MNYVISNKDSEIINKLKTVFILLVVFIHTRAYTGKGYINMTGGGIDLSIPTWLLNLEYDISEIIAHVVVPGFFIVLSMLLYKKNFKLIENALKKVWTLLAPYFIVITFLIVIASNVKANVQEGITEVITGFMRLAKRKLWIKSRQTDKIIMR